ncbi:MAG: M48 family metalloprotease [Betaproteobacteria bacterium]|nr:M48 family metalloprotease [Betaproteobacteria bacterium]
MDHSPADRIERRRMTRRDFVWLAAAAGGAVILPPLLAGCATDPVTGRSTLVGLTEQQEVAIDREQSPHQFSADYGAVQDPALNAYVDGVVRRLAAQSHRPQMPYSARVVNANYVNAYTFPGGSMGATRGILLEVQNEDELAALLGHETGHVNARHAAEQAGRQMVAGLTLALGQVALAAGDSGALLPVADLIGQIGASALLSKYSRDNEREADALGMSYMTRAGYNPDGMVRLMEMLRAQQREQPGLIETMFSSHPMSEERHQSARSAAEGTYAGQRGRALQRERYMDSTARLRHLKPAIEQQQKGEQLAGRGKLDEADVHLTQALQLAPQDYTGLVAMGKLRIAQKRFAEADNYLERATAVYPAEAQAQQLAGLTKLALKKPEAALARFDACDRALPGNPNMLFFKGVAYENMQNRRAAADQYTRFLRTGVRNEQARYAYTRLQAWGLAK